MTWGISASGHMHRFTRACRSHPNNQDRPGKANYSSTCKTHQRTEGRKKPGRTELQSEELRMEERPKARPLRSLRPAGMRGTQLTCEGTCQGHLRAQQPRPQEHVLPKVTQQPSRRAGVTHPRHGRREGFEDGLEHPGISQGQRVGGDLQGRRMQGQRVKRTKKRK